MDAHGRLVARGFLGGTLALRCGGFDRPAVSLSDYGDGDLRGRPIAGPIGGPPDAFPPSTKAATSKISAIIFHYLYLKIND